MAKLQFYPHNCLKDYISIQALVLQPKDRPKNDQQTEKWVRKEMHILGWPIPTLAELRALTYLNQGQELVI